MITYCDFDARPQMKARHADQVAFARACRLGGNRAKYVRAMEQAAHIRKSFALESAKWASGRCVLIDGKAFLNSGGFIDAA